MTDKAILILAAGYGKRMGDLTKSTPKPLLEIHKKPLLEYHLDAIEKAGAHIPVFVNTHYLAPRIEEYLSRNQRNYPVTISHEPASLGAAGAIHKILIENPNLGKVMAISSDQIYEGLSGVLTRFGNGAFDSPAAYLFLQRRQKEDRHAGAPGFHLSGKEVRKIPDGEYYYSGIGIFSRDLFRKRRALRPIEISELLDNTSSLQGEIYPKRILPAGTAKEYEILKNVPKTVLDRL